MADSFVSKLITELTAKTTEVDTDLIPVADSNGNFFKMTWQKMKQILLGTKDISGVGDGTVTGAISELNTNFSNLLEVISEESSITGAVYSQTTWKNINLGKGTYLIILFLQIKQSSPNRNYLTMYETSSDHYGTLPIADIYNAPENFSNMATTVIRVPNNCGLNISYYTPVSSTVAYHIYRIKQ